MRVCVVWGMNKIIIAGLTTIYSASFIYVLVSFYKMLRPIACEHTHTYTLIFIIFSNGRSLPVFVH